MRLLLAFDKFKTSLTAPEACEVTARALREKHPDWTLDLCPLADGGEGFAEILTRAAGGTLARVPVHGPREKIVEAALGLVPLHRIPSPARARLNIPAPAPGAGSDDSAPVAVVEMATASGLALLPPGERDPWHTTSLGTGELIRAAAEMKAAAVLLGVGGSATNDLGLGALQALGMEFLTATGAPLAPPYPAGWARLTRIAGAISHPIPPIRIACDVTNPLLGSNGAAAVYGPQKGLRPEDWERLEQESTRISRLLASHCGQPDSLAEVSGAGAAGGISFGLMAAAGAQLLSGFELVSAWLDLEARLAAADLVITGEGRFDASSLSGKGPGAVAARARALGKPVHVFAGQLGMTATDGLTLHAITPLATPPERALREASANLFASVLNVF